MASIKAAPVEAAATATAAVRPELDDMEKRLQHQRDQLSARLLDHDNHRGKHDQQETQIIKQQLQTAIQPDVESVEKPEWSLCGAIGAAA